MWIDSIANFPISASSSSQSSTSLGLTRVANADRRSTTKLPAPSNRSKVTRLGEDPRSKMSFLACTTTILRNGEDQAGTRNLRFPLVHTTRRCQTLGYHKCFKFYLILIDIMICFTSRVTTRGARIKPRELCTAVWPNLRAPITLCQKKQPIVSRTPLRYLLPLIRFLTMTACRRCVQECFCASRASFCTS